MAGVSAVCRLCGSLKKFVKGADKKKRKKKKTGKPATKLVYSFRNTAKSALLGGKEGELKEKTTPPHIIFDNLAKNISTFCEVRN